MDVVGDGAGKVGRGPTPRGLGGHGEDFISDVQLVGFPGPPWERKNGLGPHKKHTNTNDSR